MGSYLPASLGEKATLHVGIAIIAIRMFTQGRYNELSLHGETDHGLAEVFGDLGKNVSIYVTCSMYCQHTSASSLGLL